MPRSSAAKTRQRDASGINESRRAAASERAKRALALRLMARRPFATLEVDLVPTADFEGRVVQMNASPSGSSITIHVPDIYAHELLDVQLATQGVLYFRVYTPPPPPELEALDG